MPGRIKGKTSLTEILSLLVSVLAWLVGPIRFTTDWSLLTQVGLPATVADFIGVVALGWVVVMIVGVAKRLRSRCPPFERLNREFCTWVGVSALIAFTMVSTRTVDSVRQDASRTLPESIRFDAMHIDVTNRVHWYKLLKDFDDCLRAASHRHQVVDGFRYDLQVLGDGHYLRALPHHHFGFDEKEVQTLLNRRFHISQDRRGWATAVGAFVSEETLWKQNALVDTPDFPVPFLRLDDDIIATGSLIACPAPLPQERRFVLDVSSAHANSFNHTQYELIEQFVEALAKNRDLLTVIESRPWAESAR